jgi:hypothetical protein
MALPLELPISTTLMLRSIARIATEFGADLSDPAERLECIYIFTLGTPSKEDDAAETGYYASRVGFSQLLRGAASYLAANSSKDILRAMEAGSAPALAQLISRIAARFQVAVTQKTVAAAVPLIGAAGGALINAAFARHFNNAARYHFGLRRLERERGEDTVRNLYTEAASSGGRA